MYQQSFWCGDNATAADYATWGSGINTFLTASGWTLTGDYNTNWVTVSVPGAGTYQYEVWKCGDSLATTFPYWMKVEYGTAASNSCPTLRVSFGTGSGGTGSTSGTLLGNVIGPYYMQSGYTTAESAGATFECDLASDGGGRLGILMWRTSANANRPCYFAVERSLDTSGAYTGFYITLNIAGYSSGVVVNQITLYNPSNSGSLYTTASTIWATIQTSLTTLLSNLGTGNTTPLLPIYPMVGLVDNPLTQTAVGITGDNTEGSSSSGTIYSNTYNYLYSTKTNFVSVGPSTHSGIFMRCS